MSTVAITRCIADMSPRFSARMTGLFYLLTMVAGIFAQGVVSNRLIISGDASSTAMNILSHRTLFQWGFTVYLIEMVCQVVFTALFYELLKPVSRNISLVAAFIGLAGCSIKTVSRIFYIAPLFVLGGARYLTVFDQRQLHALVFLLLRINDQGAGIALAFFGFYALITGWLIFRSIFLPRVLGIWSMLAGLAWLTFLSPTLGYRLFLYIAPLAFLGAIALILWLLAVGVNEQRWIEQATAVRA